MSEIQQGKNGKKKIIKEFVDDKKELLESIVDKFFTLNREHTDKEKGLVYHFILLSSAIIGFTIPVVSSSTLVVTKEFLIIGLFLLICVIIYGFHCLQETIIKEGEFLKEANKHIELMNALMDAAKTALRDFTQENDKLFYKKLKELGKSSIYKNEENEEDTSQKILTFLFRMFVCGLIFIIFSMISL